MELRELSHAYKAAFDGPDGEAVLLDLAAFCAFLGSTVGTSAEGVVTVPVDPYQALVYEGRRQVYLRLKNMLALDDRQLADWQQRQYARERRGEPVLGEW